MPMTMREIMEKTPANRRIKAKVVKIKKIKVRKNVDGYPEVVAKTASTETPTGEPKTPMHQSNYVTAIEVYPKKKVVVSCSCADFLYTWEVALKKKGAARIEYSNGKSPKDRNPGMIPGCCGHLYALGKYLISKDKL